MKFDPECHEQVQRLELLAGNSFTFLKVPTLLILTMSKLFKQDIAQARHFFDQAFATIKDE